MLSRNSLACTSSISLRVQARSKARLASEVCRITSSAYRAHAVVISCVHSAAAEPDCWAALAAAVAKPRPPAAFPAGRARRSLRLAVGCLGCRVPGFGRPRCRDGCRRLAARPPLQPALLSRICYANPRAGVRATNVGGSPALRSVKLFLCNKRQDLRRCKNGVCRQRRSEGRVRRPLGHEEVA